MRTPLIAGNWKMNGTGHSTGILLAQIIEKSKQVPHVALALFPPFPYLTMAQSLLTTTAVAWGAQNMFEQPNGAFTGEVSVAMLQDLGCQYVILGHSERRQLFGESNQHIAQKVKAALLAGIKPILCVGETLEERDSGRTWFVVQEQLAQVFRLKDNSLEFAFESMVIAYEPVWAIGTGKTATSEQAEEVHHLIRCYCEEQQPGLGERIRILYGGSVKPDNANSLLGMPNIDGALVGGASLDADQFIAIAKAAEQNACL